MRQIEAYILNPRGVQEAEKLMVCAARLTQRGQKVKTLGDFLSLYDMGYSHETVQRMAELPHPTIQKFGVINIVVIGASRRFLAQITRHQNEVKFMSASLQYSDYSDNADFVIPYEFLDKPEITVPYLANCRKAMAAYKAAVAAGYSGDSAGYMAPQSLRNVLIISATPYQWKYMLSLRTCRRNTDETRYVMLKVWERLYELSPALFSAQTTGPFCVKGRCAEGAMTCGMPIEEANPSALIKQDFPLLA